MERENNLCFKVFSVLSKESQISTLEISQDNYANITEYYLEVPNKTEVYKRGSDSLLNNEFFTNVYYCVLSNIFMKTLLQLHFSV